MMPLQGTYAMASLTLYSLIFFFLCLLQMTSLFAPAYDEERWMLEIPAHALPLEFQTLDYLKSVSWIRKIEPLAIEKVARISESERPFMPVIYFITIANGFHDQMEPLRQELAHRDAGITLEAPRQWQSETEKALDGIRFGIMMTVIMLVFGVGLMHRIIARHVLMLTIPSGANINISQNRMKSVRNRLIIIAAATIATGAVIGQVMLNAFSWNLVVCPVLAAYPITGVAALMTLQCLMLWRQFRYAPKLYSRNAHKTAA